MVRQPSAYGANHDIWITNAPTAGSGCSLCFSPSSLSRASPCISSSSLDLYGHFCYLVGSSQILPPFLCGSPAVCCLSFSVRTLPPNRLVQLSVAPPSSCVDLHFDWFVQLSLVLDLTMWPRLLWHHMVPSSARDRRAHAHLPLPANHLPWSKTWELSTCLFAFLCRAADTQGCFWNEWASYRQSTSKNIIY